ncbi:transposase [Apiospora phragmitis]|uniref:Transposase n=1 Tax=Apiospora phragmitis TaxID=2905665 RepID=A0ABR1UIW6_9PEZI
MKQHSEEELQEALGCITNGTPTKQAAREYGIPRSEGAADLQRLSPDQEKHLAPWITAQQALGLPPTHAQVREFAEPSDFWDEKTRRKAAEGDMLDRHIKQHLNGKYGGQGWNQE